MGVLFEEKGTWKNIVALSIKIAYIAYVNSEN